jgi:poly(beta-D-mannuronate) lyase
LKHELSASPGFSNLNLARTIRGNSSTTGAPWFERRGWNRYPSQLIVDCPYPADIYKALSYDGPVVINLTGNNYAFDKPVVISGEVAIYGPADKSPVTIGSGKMLAVFVLAGKGKLTLQDINIDGSGVRASHFISSDTSGSSEHYNLLMKRCSVSKLDRKNGCTDLFFAYKSMVADSIVLRNNNFSGNQVDYVVMNQEKADKGYYNAERIVLENNTIRDSRGIVLDIYRGGNDESTMGPRLYATNNNFTAINPADSRPMVQLMGVQRTWFAGNTFQDCYQGKKLFIYKDIVRAEHVLEANTMTGSGSIDGNDFLKRKQGITQ